MYQNTLGNTEGLTSNRLDSNGSVEKTLENKGSFNQQKNVR